MLELEILHHVAVSVSDLARAKEFYGNVLGLEEIARPAFPFDGAWYRVGRSGSASDRLAGSDLSDREGRDAGGRALCAPREELSRGARASRVEGLSAPAATSRAARCA